MAEHVYFRRHGTRVHVHIRALVPYQTDVTNRIELDVYRPLFDMRIKGITNENHALQNYAEADPSSFSTVGHAL